MTIRNMCVFALGETVKDIPVVKQGEVIVLKQTTASTIRLQTKIMFWMPLTGNISILQPALFTSKALKRAMYSRWKSWISNWQKKAQCAVCRKTVSWAVISPRAR